MSTHKTPLLKADAPHVSATFVQPDGLKFSAHRHVNQDGSEGGWVADTATVHATAKIHLFAFVWPEATVGADVVVEGHWFKSGPL